MNSKNELNTKENYEGISYNDFVSNFVVDSTSDCFKTCIKDFKSKEVMLQEKECLTGCFAKFNYSYLIMSELMQVSMENSKI